GGELRVVVRYRYRVRVRCWHHIGWHGEVAGGIRRQVAHGGCNEGVVVRFLGGHGGVELEAADHWRVVEHGVREAVFRVAWR
ncbi:hypothetical protein NPN14_25380, partial [Vibrio parahaemolyticus]|uniref:hypothetical protein n=1 Tax=Vibrio parahaemolyticus TaxID=670 RepID=UPI002111870D